MDLIELEDVAFAYGDRPVLRGVNLTVPGWRLWALTRDEPTLGASVRFAVEKSVAVHLSCLSGREDG
jgi:energy-coupling factor transporter ATP-binding protein EcfA2